MPFSRMPSRRRLASYRLRAASVSMGQWPSPISLSAVTGVEFVKTGSGAGSLLMRYSQTGVMAWPNVELEGRPAARAASKNQRQQSLGDVDVERPGEVEVEPLGDVEVG